MGVIYLDNAASSWPKPPGVKEAMAKCLDEYGANPGRGGHQLAIRASKTIFQTRVKLAKLFHVQNPNDIIFTSNATHSLNMGIKGLLKKGDHVVTTTLEHNSVRRPLEYLKKERDIQISYVKPLPDMSIDLKALENEIHEKTALVIVNHASNLVGTVIPIREIGEICRRYKVPFMVDASQSAGVFPIDVQDMNIDLLAFPGHKGLYGPQGTGGLYIHPDIDLDPLFHGGTGSQSESIEQPSTRPDRYESGTMNTVGIAGLGAGVDFVLETGIDTIRAKERELTYSLMEQLEQIDGVIVHGQDKKVERAAVVAFTIEGVDAAEVAFILDQQFHIAVRSGFHCSPLGHETIGTIETGAVRASFGYFNEMSDVEALVEAVAAIRKEFK